MNTRLAITMWDFSWLTRRQGNEAEYANAGKILDELVERGYNCVRIDAFPHFLAYLEEDASRLDRFTILPEPYSRQWGNSVPVTTDLKAPLLDFLEQCRQRGVKVGLSSWYNPDTLRLRMRIKTPADFLRIWRATLRFIERNGLGDVIGWVDICNEFPFAAWAPGAYREIFATDAGNVLPYFLPWTKAACQRAQAYLDEVIPALRREFDYPFTYSSMRLARKEESVNLDCLDILEPHVWLSDTLPFGLLSLALLSTAQLPFGTDAHAWVSRRLYPALRRVWLKDLDRHLDRVAEIAHRHNKPLYTTEGWATTMYGGSPLTQDGQAWDWVREVCAEAVRLAIDKGWTGICTSNFSQPHFHHLWQDVAWHRRLTTMIRSEDTIS